MKVSEAIDHIKKGDTVWVKGKVLDFDRGGYDHCPLELGLFYEDEWIHENDEISLTEPNSISDEKVLELVSTHFRFDKENFWNQLKEIGMLPQTEKVEVPDFVAEWYESHENNLNQAIYDATIDSYDHRHKTEFEEWFIDSRNDTYGTLIRMKDGYIVKPKRWVVRFNDMETYFYFMGWSDIFRNDDNPFVPNGHLDKSDDSVIKFTERTKAEAVATLVEGSVEEV